MKKLYRSKRSKVLGGVLGGVADYFNIDPVLPRIIFLVAFFLIKPLTGLLVVVYIVACIIVPYRSDDLPENEEGSAREITKSSSSPEFQKILAWSLIIIGGVALLVVTNPFSFLYYMNKFTWPILMVVAGVLIMIASIPKKK